jgi:hypothetical protein
MTWGAIVLYLLMCFSAVYLQHHYVLDVLAGSALAFSAFGIEAAISVTIRAVRARRDELPARLLPDVNSTSRPWRSTLPQEAPQSTLAARAFDDVIGKLEPVPVLSDEPTTKDHARDMDV